MKRNETPKYLAYFREHSKLNPKPVKNLALAFSDQIFEGFKLKGYKKINKRVFRVSLYNGKEIFCSDLETTKAEQTLEKLAR